MILRKAVINGQMYDVYTEREIFEMREIDPQDRIAIVRDGILYPVTTAPRNTVSADVNNCFIRYIHPSEDDIDNYKAEGNLIDFKSDNIQELIDKSEKLKDLEFDVLCTPDRIFSPIIRDGDSPLMKGLKEAISSKKIDLDKYQHRFGSNYSNDKRLLIKDSITINKAASICEALDLKMKVIIEDASDSVANPMNKTIEIDVIGGNEDE